MQPSSIDRVQRTNLKSLRVLAIIERIINTNYSKISTRRPIIKKAAHYKAALSIVELKIFDKS